MFTELAMPNHMARLAAAKQLRQMSLTGERKSMLLLNKTLIRLARGLWGWIIAIAAFRMLSLVAVTAFAGTVSGFLGNIWTASLSADEALPVIRQAFFLALVMFACEVLRGEMEYRCTARARTLQREKIFAKVVELDAGRIERFGPVSAISTSVDAVESIQHYYSLYLPGLIYCMFSPIYLFFRLRRVSLTAALIMAVTAVLLLPANNRSRIGIQKRKKAYWTRMEDLTGYYLESLRGLTTIKLFERDRDRSAGLRARADRFTESIMDVMKVNFESFLITEAMINAALIISVAVTAWQLAAGKIALSSAILVAMLGYSFFNSFKELLSATHSAITSVAAASKIDSVLAIDTSRPFDPEAPADPERYNGIRLENISHSYEGRGWALNGVDMRIEKGKVTALAGLSGCGKSTCASLMMKFLDPSGGKIYIEGRDYLSIDPAELRKKIIMVPQSVFVFSGTVADNLRIAAPDATEDEMMEALEEVDLAEWVRYQPDGLNTDVGDEGSKLSGGQRQKIGIARALLKKAEYIIFDEATSSVDESSERDIWECIGRLALTRTLIIISHRLSTIRNADMIYVLDRGRIAQCGRHGELMEQGGLYRELVTEQKALEEGVLRGEAAE